MGESLAQRATLLFKLYLDRRQFRGPSEFSYRILRRIRGRYRLRITARDGTFRATVSLRRNTSDLATFEQTFANNSFNLRRLARWREICDLYGRIAREGTPLILDLGANVGLASLYFAKNWPRAQIIAVEPEAQNYRVTCDNLAGIPNTLPIHAGVASEDGTVRIVDPRAEAYAMRTEITAQGAPGAIPAFSVQSLLRKAVADAIPFIVKIDIEGFERNLFSKNSDWVELFPIIIIELHDRIVPGEGVASNFLRVIAQQNRDFIVIEDNVISIRNASSAAPADEWRTA
ncbi:MAG: FkbM family methyltransferase [Acetobacteraceae bacterium]